MDFFFSKPIDTETLSLEDLKASDLGKWPEAPSLESKYEIDGFDPITRPFLAGLHFMLQLFYEGRDAKEIMVLFNNKKAPFSLSFIRQVVGGDIPTVVRDYSNGEEQLKAQDRIKRDIKLFALMLQLDRIGRSIPKIQKLLEDHGYCLRQNFIWEMIYNKQQWDSRMLLDGHKVWSWWFDFLFATVFQINCSDFSLK